MQPVSFDDCFGWLHPSAEKLTSDVAVLICPGLNRDALDSHHCFRLLADEFAAAGYPTLRFNYPGTGDSGDVADGDLWATWLRSVHKAADRLRGWTGARRLILCGLRLGATLATLAAERRDDAVGLILLAPVLRGHSYMTQLFVEARLQSGGREISGDSLELYGLQLNAETVGRIRQVDLRQAKIRAGHQVMIFSQAASRVVTDCASAWTHEGAAVESAGFAGFESLLRYNTEDKAVPVNFATIIGWMRRCFPPAPIPLAHALPPDQVCLQLPGCTEIPLRFGPGERLFGMLCRPMTGDGDRAVIIVNTGRDPHYGLARFGVEFARRLAAEGIASLRMDFGGLGDSVGAAGEETVMSSMFETDRAPDISAAMTALDRLDYRHFTIQGVCAGAYHALHGALADPRISSLLLINMPVFTWRSGDTTELVAHKLVPPSHYLLKLGERNTWHRLLHGKYEFGSILRAQKERLNEHARKKRLLLDNPPGQAGAQSFAHRAMATLSRRRARTLFLFAPDDRGLRTMAQAFGPGDAGLRAFEGASMQVVAELDHDLSGRLMRRTAADLMIGFLTAPSRRVARTVPLSSPPITLQPVVSLS